MQSLSKNLTALVMGVVILAGLLKLADLPGFFDSLHTWTSIPNQAVPLIVFVVPSIEFLSGGLWVVGIGRRRVELLLLLFLCVVTAGYAIEWHLAKPPNCGCLGVLSRYLSKLDESRHVLFRNTMLILVLAIRLAVERRVSRKATRGVVQCRGFTLIETILVIALIAILISLSAPSLSRFRDDSRLTVSLANLRSHSAVFSMYSNDFRSMYPYATTPAPGVSSVVRCLSKKIAVPARYFDMTDLWHIAMADSYYDGNPTSRSLGSPLNPYRRSSSTPMLATDYFYSCTFLASPEYYSPATHRVPPSQLRAVRVDEAVFPSMKYVLLDYGVAVLSSSTRAIPSTFIDGHAASTVFEDALMHRDGDGGEALVPFSGHFPGKWPLPHTADGVRGRDVR